MKKKIFFFIIVFLCSSAFVLIGLGIEKSFLSSEEKTQYSEYLGFMLWKKLKHFSYYDFDNVLKTINDLENGKKFCKDFQLDNNLIMKVLEKQEKDKIENNLKKAEEYLTKIREKKGIVELKKDKLFYEVLKEGDGDSIKEDAYIYIYFKEMDIFENVIRENLKDPVKIKLSETIAGMRYATKGMKVGEKRKIYIHPDLAYGKIRKKEPNQVILLEIEIKKGSKEQSSLAEGVRETEAP